MSQEHPHDRGEYPEDQNFRQEGLPESVGVGETSIDIRDNEYPGDKYNDPIEENSCINEIGPLPLGFDLFPLSLISFLEHRFVSPYDFIRP